MDVSVCVRVCVCENLQAARVKLSKYVGGQKGDDEWVNTLNGACVCTYSWCSKSFDNIRNSQTETHS